MAIVLIDGIGSQTTGGTLIHWAEPIVQQLKRLGHQIDYGATDLTNDPAYVTIHFAM